MLSLKLHHCNVWVSQINSALQRRETGAGTLGKEQSLRGTCYSGYWRGLITTSFSTQEIVSSRVFLVSIIYQRKSLPQGFWLFKGLGSILWIKQKEIAINIKQKEIAITGGIIFPMQYGEKQNLTKQRRTLALYSIPVLSFLAPKSREGP